MARLTLLLAALLIAFAQPAAAQTQETNAPPGNSAIDEYVETVPGASGNRTPRRPDPATSTLAPAQRRALEQAGPEGEQLAELVDATAPPPTPRTSTATGERSPGTAPPVSTPTPAEAEQAIVLADTKASSPVRSALAAAIGPNDAGGLGIFFPVLLLASLVGTVVLTMRRRRPSA